MKKALKPSSENGTKNRSKRKEMYLSTFVSFVCFSIGFSRYKDIKTQGYYLERKYQVVIYGDQGLLTVYALLAFGLIFLFYSIYLLINENN